MGHAPVDAAELFFVESGTGLPCLVMHGGLGVDHTYLRPWLDPLGDVLRLVYYDHRGNGRSSRPPMETLTLAQLAADADALRAHLNIDRVAVFGHSFGGIVALEHALRYPTRVSHLVLCCTTAAFDHWDQIEAGIRRKNPAPEVLAAWRTAPADDAAMAESARVATRLYLARDDPALAERLFTETVFSAAASRRGSELVQGHDVTARLTEIEVPTLVLAGRDDFMAPPAQAERLRRGIPDAELVVFEESGHHPYAEEPEPFVAVVHDWLARADGRASKSDGLARRRFDRRS